MRRLFTLGLLGAFLAGPVAAQEPRQVFAIVTAAETQTQGMAFVLLSQMRAQGAEVRVMLCGPAGDLARREPPGGAGQTLRPRDVTPAQMFRGLLAAGATAEVCALYLPNAGVGPEALLDGVRPAQPPAVARRMLQPGVAVFTF